MLCKDTILEDSKLLLNYKIIILEKVQKIRYYTTKIIIFLN